MSNILANKYRPRKIRDIIGQDINIKILSNSISQNKMHHAFIFHGNMGSGKTSLARILAASENCVDGPTLTPCGKCQNCIDIFSGKSLDVKEIDAASNRGIDEIRDLKNELIMAPINGRYKYIILDETHSLTSYAAEALLKVIEEPPPYVRFILCTTEIQKLPNTILSRCLCLNFNKISWNEIETMLCKICKAEGYDFEEGSISHIARRSFGSARNGINNLEKVILNCKDKKIDTSTVLETLGAISTDRLYDIFDSISKADVNKTFIDINNMVVCNNNPELVFSEIISYLHTLMCIKAHDQELKEIPSWTDEDIKKARFLIGNLKITLISSFLENIIFIKRGIIVNVDLQSMLEVWAINCIKEVKRAQLNEKNK